MLTFNNYNLTFDNQWLYPRYRSSLPPFTIRVELNPGATLSIDYTTCTQISSSPNIWDVCTTGGKDGDWRRLFANNDDLLGVIDANSVGVYSMSNIFWSCDVLHYVHVFDTHDVTDMQYMFSHCYALQILPTFDTSNVTRMHGMFSYSTSLVTVPKFDTRNVTDMHNMFSGCGALQYVPTFDTSKVTDMHGMFNDCRALQYAPLLDTSKVTDISGMFLDCETLTQIPLFNTRSVTNISRMFSGCVNIESGALALYQQVSTQANPPATHIEAFYNCGTNTVTGAAELAQIPDDWK